MISPITIVQDIIYFIINITKDIRIILVMSLHTNMFIMHFVLNLRYHDFFYC